MNARYVVLFLSMLSFLGSCSSTPPPAAAAPGRNGHLLVIGGGLDNDVRPVFERFLALAAAPGLPHVVIATAATGEQQVEVTDKTEALRAWAPSVPVEAILRETSTVDTVAAIDRATALLFTGGDQARITARYRPEGKDTPEWLAMQRLLARGGVIAGCSAGDAMMGEVMLLDGKSGAALGAAGPQIGPGMALLPWAITDSHFFERDRMGRLVAALETSGRRLGVGVGEDAAVDIDLARGELLGVTVSDSLLIDVAPLLRDGQARRHVRARLIRLGDRVPLRELLTTACPPPVAKPASPAQTMSIVEPGQNRQLASWRVFAGACRVGSGVWTITFDDWRLAAWPDGSGEVIFDVEPK